MDCEVSRTMKAINRFTYFATWAMLLIACGVVFVSMSVQESPIDKPMLGKPVPVEEPPF